MHWNFNPDLSTLREGEIVEDGKTRVLPGQMIRLASGFVGGSEMQSLTIPIFVASAGALIASITDLWTFKVYNALTIPLMCGALIYHGVVGGPTELLQSLGGMMLGVALLLLPFLMGGMGAGDVKLLAAVGAWLGIAMTFYVFVASAFASGICAFLMLVFQHSLEEAWNALCGMFFRLCVFVTHLKSDEWMQSVVPNQSPRRRVIPYGVMVAFGIVAVMIWSNARHGS